MEIRSASGSPRGRLDDPALRPRSLERSLENSEGILALRNKDNRAAEASTGHPRTDSSCLECGRDDSVELGSGDLVVVAQAGMTCAEERGQRRQVVPLERVNGRAHAFVLADDVPDAARMSRLELGTAVGVAGCLERVSLARVDDENRKLRGKLDP